MTVLGRQEVGRCHTRGESRGTYTPLPNANNATHPGFEIQSRRHQKSKKKQQNKKPKKTGVSVTPWKVMCPPNI